MNIKQLFGMIMSVGVLVAVFLLPIPEGLTDIGFITIGLLIFFLIMLITEALPVGVICFLSLALLPILGVTKNLGTGLIGFSNTMLFFVLASFGLAEAVTSTQSVQRVLHTLLKKFGKDVKTCILAIMVTGGLVSSLVTDVPTVVVFMGIGASFLKLYKNDADRQQTARPLMIGIPVAIMLGGVMTPAGSGINILTIGLLQNIAGIQITFVQWMVCAIPIVVLMLPLAWFVLMKIYPPAEIDQAEIQSYLTTIEVKEKISKTEWKVITIALGMMFFWVLSSFVSGIEVTIVALVGCSLFFCRESRF